jgi:phosphatidylglycerol lysyltransferase
MFTFKNKIVFLLLILATTPFCSSPAQVPTQPPPPVDPRHQNISMAFKRGPLNIFRYSFHADDTRKVPDALILFASGGGGWTEWEEKVCDNLRNHGYEVLGFDVNIYGQTDYDLDTLQQDFRTLAEYGLNLYGNKPLPVIIGGWSSGAEQAVAIAGGPHPPAGLVGLFLLAPGSWGGYGFYASNDVGPRIVQKGTFALTDFAPNLTHLRIIQWHAQFDFLDSREWLSTLKAPHREYDMSNAIHFFGDASDDFLRRLNEGLAWILGNETPAPSSK